MELLNFWLCEIGCSHELLNPKFVNLCVHPHVQGYSRVFYFKTKNVSVISVPNDLFQFFSAKLTNILNDQIDLETIKDLLSSKLEKIIGPAWIGTIEPGRYRKCHQSETRVLYPVDFPCFAKLLQECDPVDVKNSGFEDMTLPTVGVFTNSEMVAAANYKIIKEKMANIGVIVSPKHRGRGFSKNAISGITEMLFERSFVIQYQTISSNVSSVKAARSVGFYDFAETISFKCK